MVHSQQRFWWTISPRKLYLICGVKVGKCQLLVAKCCQYQTLFCMTVTSKKWFNLFSRWRSRRACRRGDLFSMCQDHQSTHWIIPLLHPFMFLSPCTQGFGRSEALHKVHYGAIYSLFFFWKEIFLSPVKKHSNSTNVFLSHRGLNKQGYKCRRECFIDPPLCFLLSACWNSSGWNILFVPPECNAAIHKRCIEKIIGKCTGSAANSRDTMVSKVNVSASVTSGVF